MFWCRSRSSHRLQQKVTSSVGSPVAMGTEDHGSVQQQPLEAGWQWRRTTLGVPQRGSIRGKGQGAREAEEACQHLTGLCTSPSLGRFHRRFRGPGSGLSTESQLSAHPTRWLLDKCSTSSCLRVVQGGVTAPHQWADGQLGRRSALLWLECVSLQNSKLELTPR